MVFLSADRLSCGSPRETNSVGEILPHLEWHFQVEKRRRVGGPFAALSGGMSDVRSLQQRHPIFWRIAWEDHEGISGIALQIIEMNSQTNALPLNC
jgi:hypothetical protein